MTVCILTLVATLALLLLLWILETLIDIRDHLRKGGR